MIDRKQAYIGMRVQLNKDIDNISSHTIKRGSTGAICKIYDDFERTVGVRFDDNINGHSCGNTCDFGHGWNVALSCIDEMWSYDTEDSVDCDTLMSFYGVAT